jgi:hypothetical protein
MDIPIIGPSSHAPLEPTPGDINVPALARDMQETTSTFASNLQKALDDPHLSSQPSFLQSVQENIQQLQSLIEKANLLR